MAFEFLNMNAGGIDFAQGIFTTHQKLTILPNENESDTKTDHKRLC